MDRYKLSKASARAFATACILVGYLALSACGKSPAPSAPPPAAPPEVAVITIQPERVTITTELAGRTSAYLMAEVRPQVGGIIQKRLFTEGSNVKAGEVLYQIDQSSFQAAYASAKAALARAEANVTPLRLKVERYKQLIETDAVSRQSYDELTASLMQAQAEVEGAGAALEAAHINMTYTSVAAPISGRIGRSSVTVGALVTANQPNALATIQQLDPVYVDVAQSSANLLRLRQSIESGKLKHDSKSSAVVRLILEDGSSYPHTGTLKFSDVTVDPSTGSVTLRTVFPNPSLTLLPGMYVRALIEEGVNEQAILVPQRGVTRDSKGDPTAMVVDSSDKVEMRVLKVERAIGDKWLVSAGLGAGDRVILEGLQKIRPGVQVKVVPFGAEAPATTPPADQKK